MKREVRAAAVLLAAAGTLTATGCAGHVTAHVISGRLVRVGGPAPGAPVPLPGRVVARSASGQRYSVTVGRDGRFRLKLPPGVYRFTGRSQLINSGRQLCSASRPVRVDDHSHPIQVICSIR